MNLLFILVISLPLFSQSILDLNRKPIYLDAVTVEDIKSFSLDSIPPYIYMSIPDLSDLDVKKRKKKFIELILPSILFEKEKIENAYNYVVQNFNIMHPLLLVLDNDVSLHIISQKTHIIPIKITYQMNLSGIIK